MIDVSTPAAPVAVGSFDALAAFDGVRVSAGHVFVANGDAGMSAFRD